MVAEVRGAVLRDRATLAALIFHLHRVLELVNGSLVWQGKAFSQQKNDTVQIEQLSSSLHNFLILIHVSASFLDAILDESTVRFVFRQPLVPVSWLIAEIDTLNAWDLLGPADQPVRVQPMALSEDDQALAQR